MPILVNWGSHPFDNVPRPAPGSTSGTWEYYADAVAAQLMVLRVRLKTCAEEKTRLQRQLNPDSTGS